MVKDRGDRRTSDPHGKSAPRMGERGWFPDHTAERRADLARTTPAERVLEAIQLSRFQTRVAIAGRE